MVRRFRNSYPDLEVSLLELTTVQQVEALKKQQIDVGFGRLYLDDPAVRREVLRKRFWSPRCRLVIPCSIALAR